MEYLEGGTLYDIIQVHNLTEIQMAIIIKQTLLALDYLHSKNIFHRDIHSENILVGFNGEIKLAGLIFLLYSTSEDAWYAHRSSTFGGF